MTNLKNNFRKLLKSKYNLETQLIDEMLSSIEVVELLPGKMVDSSILANIGLFYVASGLVRIYAKELEEDVTFTFIAENTLLVHLDQLLDLKLIQSATLDPLEASVCFFVSSKQLLNLRKTHFEFSEFSIKALVGIMAQMAKRRILMNSQPYERFLEVNNIYPGIINRAPQTAIASYIGVTPVSFSRMKKRYIESLE